VNKINNRLGSSFRDPSGFIFTKDRTIYRQINNSYKENYDFLFSSGLYQALVDANLLVKHTEVSIEPPDSENEYKIIQPEQIPYISYPYEWSFSQLKDAALATIRIQKIALEHGMSLKDASAYNMQFTGGNWLMIDTLSFEKYNVGQPWVAYRQFCKHFLAPLALMSFTDIRLSSLLINYIDGIPLDLCAKILPKRTKFKFSLLTHIHLHAKSESHYADKQVSTTGKQMSKQAMMGIIDSLESAVKKMRWNLVKTEWGDYYNDTNYTETGFETKKDLVSKFIEQAQSKSLWDLGANLGLFSRIASDKNIPTVAFDIDPIAVEKNYLQVKSKKEKNILPLLSDLTNPSPAIGWGNNERDSFMQRGKIDTVMALALIHHLAIGNNLPFEMIMKFFYEIIDRHLIIEFVPKSDSQVQRLLASREDIFPKYDIEHFEQSFLSYFKIVEKKEIKDTQRTLYLLEKTY